MKYSAAILALATTVFASTTKDLPSCSRKILEHGVTAGGCKTNDFACSCARTDILAPILVPLVQQVCGDAELDKAITVVEGICLNAGIPVTIARPAPYPTLPIVSTSSLVPLPSSSHIPDITISLPIHTPSIITVTISEPLPTSILPSTCSLTTITQTVTLRLPPVPTVGLPSIINPPFPTTNATAPLPTGTNPAVPSSEISILPSSTGPVGTGVLPSVTASRSSVPSAVTSGIPAFTGAAMALKVPISLFGLLGAALFL